MSRIHALIIDDEADVCTFFRRLLQSKGYEVATALNQPEALKALETSSFDIAMVDLKLPDTDGLTLLKLIKKAQPSCQVIIMTGYSTIKTAVTAIQLGAYEYIEKPFDNIDQIEALIEKAARAGKNPQQQEQDSKEWGKIANSIGFQVGTSDAMQRLVSLAYKIATKNINVLINGETGTGKEVLARFIHAASARANQMFIPVNCGALPENLLESELFGHEKGAFTGANNTRRGIFELANHGTLFLDEIGDATPAIQVKLLRVLETGEFMRLGGERQVKTDVRVVSATNVGLEQAIEDKTFREDLFYRVNVVTLEIPPLRERAEDIPLLAEHFIRQFNPELSISADTMDLLCRHHWPGNIRELANVLRQAVALCEGDLILPEHLRGKLALQSPTQPVQTSSKTAGQAEAEAPAQHPSPQQFWEHYGQEDVLEKMSGGELSQMLMSLHGLEKCIQSVMRKKGVSPPSRQGLKESEREVILQTLEEHRWNITETAQALGIARNTLHRKIKNYGFHNK